MISLKYAVTGFFLLTAFSFSFKLQAQSVKEQSLSDNKQNTYASYVLPMFQSKEEVIGVMTSFRQERKNFRCSFLTLNNLAKAAESIDNTEAFDCLYNLLVLHQHNLDDRKNLFESLVAETQGTILLRDPG